MPAAAQTASSRLRDSIFATPGSLRLRAAPADGAAPKVDLAAGVLRGVSLITGNIAAKGWPFFIDAKTVAMFSALLAGRRLKAYATHGDFGRDGTLDEVGYWDSTTIAGANLRADFTALDAWRKYHEADFATLFELATKLPQEFGASLAFGYQLAWVRTNGEDVPTSICDWDFDEDRPCFDPTAPADAVRSDLPSVRPVSVSSADFVDDPAANEGLFRANSAALKNPAVDGPGNGIAETPQAKIKTAAMLTTKELHARFSANPAHLARAMALSVANESHTMDQIAATITNEEQGAELAQLRTGAESAKTEIATLKAAKQNFETEEAKLSAAGFKPADGKTAVDVALAEVACLKAAVADKDTALAALRGGGAIRVKTGEGGEISPAPGGAELRGVRRAAASFCAHFAAAGITKPAESAKK